MWWFKWKKIIPIRIRISSVHVAKKYYMNTSQCLTFSILILQNKTNYVVLLRRNLQKIVLLWWNSKFVMNSYKFHFNSKYNKISVPFSGSNLFWIPELWTFPISCSQCKIKRRMCCDSPAETPEIVLSIVCECVFCTFCSISFLHCSSLCEIKCFWNLWIYHWTP